MSVFYLLLFLGAVVAAKLVWVGWLYWNGRVDDDEDGPVSGWGTPRG